MKRGRSCLRWRSRVGLFCSKNAGLVVTLLMLRRVVRSLVCFFSFADCCVRSLENGGKKQACRHLLFVTTSSPCSMMYEFS